MDTACHKRFCEKLRNVVMEHSCLLGGGGAGGSHHIGMLEKFAAKTNEEIQVLCRDMFQLDVPIEADAIAIWHTFSKVSALRYLLQTSL